MKKSTKYSSDNLLSPFWRQYTFSVLERATFEHVHWWTVKPCTNKQVAVKHESTRGDFYRAIMNSRACKVHSSLQSRKRLCDLLRRCCSKETDTTDNDKVVIAGCNHVQKKFAMNLRGRLLKKLNFFCKQQTVLSLSKRMNSRELTSSRCRSSKRVEESKHAMKRNVEFQRAKEIDYDFSSGSKSISESGCLPSHLQKQFVLSVLFATSNHCFNARPQITIEKARSSCLEHASNMYQAIPRDKIVVW